MNTPKYYQEDTTIDNVINESNENGNLGEKEGTTKIEEVRELTKTIYLLTEQVTKLTKTNEALIEYNKNLKTTIERLWFDIDSQEKVTAEMTGLIKKLLKNKSIAAKNKANDENIIAMLENELASLKVVITTLKTEKQFLMTQMLSLKQEKNLFVSKINANNDDHKSLANVIPGKEIIPNASLTLIALREDYAAMLLESEQQVTQLQATITAITTKNTDLNDELDQLTLKYQQLSETNSKLVAQREKMLLKLAQKAHEEYEKDQYFGNNGTTAPAGITDSIANNTTNNCCQCSQKQAWECLIKQRFINWQNNTFWYKFKNIVNKLARFFGKSDKSVFVLININNIDLLLATNGQLKRKFRIFKERFISDLNSNNDYYPLITSRILKPCSDNKCHVNSYPTVPVAKKMGIASWTNDLVVKKECCCHDNNDKKMAPPKLRANL